MNNAQELLYSNYLFDFDEDVYSELRKQMLLLFPLVKFNHLLEFVGIKTLVHDNKCKIILHLSETFYESKNGFTYISYEEKTSIQILQLPMMINSKVEVFKIQKVFMLQLVKSFGVRFNFDDDDINIDILTCKNETIKFSLNDNGFNVFYNKISIDLFAYMFELGIKLKHISAKVCNETHLVWHENQWKQISFINNFNALGMEYGKRRKLRSITRLKAINDSFSRKKLFNMFTFEEFKPNLTPRKCGVLYLAYENALETLNALDNNIRDGKCKEASKSLGNILNLLIGNACMRSINYFTKSDMSIQSCYLTKSDLFKIMQLLVDCEEINFDNIQDERIKGVGEIIMHKILDEIDYQLSVNYLSDQRYGILELEESLEDLQADINNLLSTSELCQYLEQTNSLCEYSHRLRLTHRAPDASKQVKSDLRDVKPWHFTRICPIESPEGSNIGLIMNMCYYTHVTIDGLITSGFRKIVNGILTNSHIHLNCFEEAAYNIVNVNKISNNLILSLNKNVELTHISPIQTVSATTCLIPFLEHNDANRVLMAANMQKQAVPLISPKPPLVCTGEEHNIIAATGHNIIAENDCFVEYVDSSKIIVYDKSIKTLRTYPLSKITQTNQGTWFRQRTHLEINQFVKAGSVLAECQSSSNNKLALGANLLAAFVCWDGLNYEDSIVISNKVAASGALDSNHIIELEIAVYSTKLGEEKLTNNIPNVSKALVKKINQYGLPKVGDSFSSSEIIIGKITPVQQGGNKIAYVDSSLRIPADYNGGTLIEISESTENDSYTRGNEVSRNYSTEYNLLRKKYIRLVGAIMEKCKLVYYKCMKIDIFCFMSLNIKTQIVINKLYNEFYRELALLLDGFDNQLKPKTQPKTKKVPKVGSTKVGIIKQIRVKLLATKHIQPGDKLSGRHGNKGVISRIVPEEDMPFMEDGTSIDIIFNPLSVPSRMNLGQIFEAHLGLVSYNWGLEFSKILNNYNLSKDDNYLRLAAISKLREIYPNFDLKTRSISALLSTLETLCNGVNLYCPSFNRGFKARMDFLLKRGNCYNDYGKVTLRDGRTGEKLENKITVGYVYVFKLNHLVEDKIHVRSTGPYSETTQQPLKGKANFGGQRVGEMEVWALECYGSSFVLQEMMSVKSDDMYARQQVYRSFLEGVQDVTLSLNESFVVLIKELCSLCVHVDVNVENLDEL